MSENPLADGGINTAPLIENSYVSELLDLLDRCDRDASGLIALINHVTDMEQFVSRADEKLADMKSQLDKLKEVRDHPFKSTLQKAVAALEHRINAAKEYISGLKTKIAEGCKKALSAAHDKGVSALGSIASFFKLKDALSYCSKDFGVAINDCDRAISKIEAFSEQYQAAKSAVKNMGRVMLGKEPHELTVKVGKLASSLAGSYKVQRSIFIKMKSSADKAIVKLDELDKIGAAKRETEKKPSLMKKLAEKRDLAEQSKHEAPTPERTKTKGMAI